MFYPPTYVVTSYCYFSINFFYFYACSQTDIKNESIPKIVPLYDGQELKINQKLIINGLSTISIRNMKTKEFAIKVMSKIC